MNEELIKFIELCLSDGVITEKEREVIFRKSKELGVPDDECEILIDSLVSKYSKKTSPPKPTKKKGGFFSSMFNEIKKNIDTDSIKSSFNKVKDDIKKGYDIEKEKIEKELKKIREEQNKTTSSNKTSKTKTTSPKIVNTNKLSSPKFCSCDEVTVIIKPKVIPSPRIKGETETHFYDLSGNRVTKIPRTKRNICLKYNCYLGLKNERWVEINPDEVENKLNDSEFIEVHSLVNKSKTPSKRKVSKEQSIKNINKKIEDKKVDESVEVIKEEISNEVIRIITKDSISGFFCFEFKTDCIKVFTLMESLYGDHEGSPCFIEQFDEKLYKVLEKDNDIKIKDSEVFRYFINDFLKPPVKSTVKLFDFGYEKVSFVNKRNNKPMEYIDIKYSTSFDDGSGGVSRMGFSISFDEIRKVEKIIYLFNNITSNNDIISLNESYLKYHSKIIKEKDSLLKEFDVDSNGVVDVLENTDLQKLLKSKQKTLIEFEKSEGKSYVQNFIKLTKFLGDKSKNIQSLFETLKEGTNFPTTDYLNIGGILRNQIHTYNLMLISSLNMIISLIDDDRITFYEIYETFDKLNVFSSNHEKEVSMKLSNIENKLEDVIESIHDMEISICNELMNLQFISEDISESINGLSQGLMEINSSINTNNILTGIQTYQMYKINQNTKGLR